MRVGWLDVVDAPLIDALRALPKASEAPDLSSLFARADRHGLLGVVFDACEAGGHHVPAALASDLRTRELARDLDHQAHLAMLVRIDEALAACGLSAVALKGALLGERLYPRPSARATSDIDLLVAERDLDSAARALAKVGYVGEAGPSEDRFRREHHHLHFAHPHALPLELHFHAYRGFGRTFSSEPLIARSHRPSSRWKAVRVLEPADELVYLSVHAAAHRFVRLGWLYDLKLLLATMSGEDVGIARARARDLGYARALDLALGLTKDVFGHVLGEASGLGERHGRMSLREPLLKSVLREPSHPWLRSATRFVYTTSLCDSLSAAAVYASASSLGHAKRILGLAP